MPIDVLDPKNVSVYSIRKLENLVVDYRCELCIIPLSHFQTMLTLLKIRNLALVDSLSWNIGSGLVGVTGETGAGKSVIVGALKLILGERAVKDMIRTGESTCTVEAVFELPGDSPILAVLEDAGVELDEDDILIIKRAIGAGSNKQFVNNSPVTLSLLKLIGQHLVDLHGPHDHQSLLSNERQLSMLDAYAGSVSDYAGYQTLYREWKAKEQSLNDLISAELASDQELDLLRFQVEEIDAAQLVPAEEADIEDRYKRASNSSRITESAGGVVALLSGGINDQLSEVQRLARELEQLDPAISDTFAGLDSAVMEIQELERSMVDYVAESEVDPTEVNSLENRINTFETLKRKYGPSIEDVVAHGKRAHERLTGLDDRDEQIDALKAEVTAALVLVEKAGLKLSSKRKKLAPKLGKVVAGHLKDLGFKQAAFELMIQSHSQPDSNGYESVDFQFGPNPGEPLKSLKSIASSGEISRVMLAVKSALAQQDFTPLMVFDEIDANVGGEIARSVGEKMAVLGEQHQVISITHFPQVAAVARQHFVVEKKVLEGRTVSGLVEVEGDKRTEELVRMLGGGDGKEAREMALSLLAKR